MMAKKSKRGGNKAPPKHTPKSGRPKDGIPGAQTARRYGQT